MSIRISNGLRKALAGPCGVRTAMGNGVLQIFSGTQPATANDATSGTLLCTFTLGGNAHTPETRATASIKITGGTANAGTNYLYVKVGGVRVCENVNWTTSHANTATLLAAAINSYLSVPDVTAEIDGGDSTRVIIKAPYYTGAAWDTVDCAATLAGDVTTTDTDFGAGTNGTTAGVTAVNGLNWQYPDTNGVLTKETSIWMGTAIASGTAGWFRFVIEGTTADTGLADSSGLLRRMDGSVGTSGADLNLSSTSITSGSIQSIANWTLTVPAS